MTEVFIITGATCSGKTEMSLELAKSLGAEIISCDSVQVYRQMDIGSAKATARERGEIPHHLIDVADCSKTFDVSEYVAQAKAALSDIRARGKNVVVCGGSGFYLRSWFAAVTDNVKISESAKLFCEETEKLGANALTRELLKIDPDAAQTVDVLNPRRAKNALARCLSSGKTCAQLAADFAALPCPFGEIKRNVRILELPKENLEEKIRARTEDMIARGLVDETRELIKAGIKQNPSARAAIGYRETIEWIESGGSDVSELSRQITENTLALVKKQRKYFKNSLLKGADYTLF